MTTTRRDAGNAGEDAALHYLRQAGLQLLLRNYRCRMGEIDLVMQEGATTLALVEVRVRTSSDFGGAAASVGYRKQRRLILAAHHLLMTRADLRQFRARFDVVALEHAADGAPRIEWLRDAFRL